MSSSHDADAMNPIDQYELQMTRRQLLARGRGCLGAAALATLLAADQAAAAPRIDATLGIQSGFAGVAALSPRRQNGSSTCSWRAGPAISTCSITSRRCERLHGTELPDSIRNGQRLTGMSSGQKTFPCVAPMFKFDRYGERGTWVNSDLLAAHRFDRRRDDDRPHDEHRSDQS